jgi:hypothetical protein
MQSSMPSVSQSCSGAREASNVPVGCISAHTPGSGDPTSAAASSAIVTQNFEQTPSPVRQPWGTVHPPLTPPLILLDRDLH